jgi:excisionase family DNA binding protein
MALPRIAYSVHDAAIVSGLSRSKLYELMKSGALPSVKLGARRLIRHADLAAVFDQEVSNG